MVMCFHLLPEPAVHCIVHCEPARKTSLLLGAVGSAGWLPLLRALGQASGRSVDRMSVLVHPRHFENVCAGKEALVPFFCVVTVARQPHSTGGGGGGWGGLGGAFFC